MTANGAEYALDRLLSTVIPPCRARPPSGEAVATTDQTKRSMIVHVLESDAELHLLALPRQNREQATNNVKR
jgi:hypothetical protein